MGCFAADQLLKAVVRARLAPGESMPFLGEWFRLTHVENRAGVMGISVLPLWALTLISLPAVGYMLWWLWRRLPAEDWLARLLPWVLGGALGNLWDRAVNHKVTDMFDVDIPDLSLPAVRWLGFDGLFLERWWVFNLADSFIFVCMIWLVVLGFLGKLEDPPAPEEPASDGASS